jgi:hypothetical protein
MLIAEAQVATERSGRYLVQLCPTRKACTGLNSASPTASSRSADAIG